MFLHFSCKKGTKYKLKYRSDKSLNQTLQMLRIPLKTNEMDLWWEKENDNEFKNVIAISW